MLKWDSLLAWGMGSVLLLGALGPIHASPVPAKPVLVASAQVKAVEMAPDKVLGPPTQEDLARRKSRKHVPMERMVFSARQGFLMRMISNEEVTAEIRNGAGRTLARAKYNLEVGDWRLHPRNVPPGLYTVMLWNGPRLRAMRMKIEDVERGHGAPEWVLEKAPADSALTVEVKEATDPSPGH